MMRPRPYLLIGVISLLFLSETCHYSNIIFVRRNSVLCTVWQAEGAFRTTTIVHQKPNLRLIASARGRRSMRYVAVGAREGEEREQEEEKEASDCRSNTSVSSDLGLFLGI